MKNASGLVLVLLLSFAFAGCERKAESPAGFRLPDGNAEAGRRAFTDLYCYDCHSIPGENFPDSLYPSSPNVTLGGESTRVTTYGELVTSIINPSHKLARGYPESDISIDGQSKMQIYNEYMTVQQLTDLVFYLQPKYEVVIPQHVYRPFP